MAKANQRKAPLKNPYQHIDFTAYTLEWGEVQLDLNQTSIGILPRTQIGTQVLLTSRRNQQCKTQKVNLLRVVLFDSAVTGDLFFFLRIICRSNIMGSVVTLPYG